jgi:hypothetical protein
VSLGHSYALPLNSLKWVNAYSLPMATWLSNLTHMPDETNLPEPPMPRTPWARPWARAVIKGMMECE